MSYNDLEESHQDVCSDSESEPTRFSSLDSAKIQGTNVCSPSVNQTRDRASFKCWEHPSIKSAPYKGNPAGHVPLEEAESCKGEEILESQPIRPFEASLHRSFCVTVAGPWVEGGGCGERG